jgi:hypothetical protein
MQQDPFPIQESRRKDNTPCSKIIIIYEFWTIRPRVAMDVAMDYYRALDNSRYASFKTSLVNNINSGAIEQPATLNEMYTQAAAFLVPTKQSFFC